METHPRFKFTAQFLLFIIIFLSLGLISFILCIAAEFMKNKKDDLRWNGEFCHLPSSKSYGLGVAALVCFFMAQIIGNSIFFKNSCSIRKRDAQFKIPDISKVLFLSSWLSFGFAIMLLMAATSMSRKQPYGVGWLKGECYLVKGGTFAGTAVLVLATLGFITGSALSTMRTSQADQGQKIHAQIGSHN